MNTIRSTYIGWGALVVAGGGAYFFAKRSIDADKRTKFEAMRQKKRRDAEMEDIQTIRAGTSQPPPANSKTNHRGQDHAGSPSHEASDDPAPTNHRGNGNGNGNGPRSKYEPKVPYRSPKGDRFT